MIKTSITFSLCFSIALLIGLHDLQAYNKRHWENLIRTKCCQNCKLDRAPLSNINLTGADLSGSDLTNANFKQATLFEVKLPDPEKYVGANFSGAMWIDGTICKPGSIGFCNRD